MRQGVRDRIRLKGVKVVAKPDGRRYVYRRVGAKLVPLPDLPHTDERFLAAYLDAGRVPIRVAEKGSVEAIAERYQASDDWRALSAGTREVRARLLRHITAKAGALPIAGLRPKHIKADLAKLDPVPANSRLKVWRALLTFAVAEDVLDENPALAVEPKKAATSPHVPWWSEQIEAFRSRWPIGAAQRTALEVLCWSGARCSDAVRLGPGMVDEAGWLHFTQQKTGGEVSIPWTCPLPPMWRPFAADHAHLLAALAVAPSTTYLATTAGDTRSIKAMSQWFSGAARSAGLSPDYTAHGLRKSRAIAIVEIGGTTHQVGAWTGHKSLKEIEGYTAGASRRRILGFTGEA